MINKAPLCLLAVCLVLFGCEKKEAAVVATAPAGKCVLDAVNLKGDALVHVKPGDIHFRGWALPLSGKPQESEVEVLLTDKNGAVYSFDDYVRVERADVAKAYNNEDYRHAGYSVKAAGKELKPGVYTISLKVKRKGTGDMCSLKKNIVVDAA